MAGVQTIWRWSETIRWENSDNFRQEAKGASIDVGAIESNEQVHPEFGETMCTLRATTFRKQRLVVGRRTRECLSSKQEKKMFRKTALTTLIVCFSCLLSVISPATRQLSVRSLFPVNTAVSVYFVHTKQFSHNNVLSSDTTSTIYKISKILNVLDGC